MNDTSTASGTPSGRFLLRISPRLHGLLRSAAEEAGLSLNELCARKLAGPGPDVIGPAAPVIARARDQFADRLVGILAFGSWARGEATEESDVDLVVVVDPSVPLVRSLYHPWDEHPLAWDGRRVEVLIVHPPSAGEPPSGLWAEIALDGIMVFDPELDLSRRLVDVRHRISGGVVRRQSTQGHPYWVSGGRS